MLIFHWNCCVVRYRLVCLSWIRCLSRWFYLVLGLIFVNYSLISYRVRSLISLSYVEFTVVVYVAFCITTGYYDGEFYPQLLALPNRVSLFADSFTNGNTSELVIKSNWQLFVYIIQATLHFWLKFMRSKIWGLIVVENIFLGFIIQAFLSVVINTQNGNLIICTNWIVSKLSESFWLYRKWFSGGKKSL